MEPELQGIDISLEIGHPVSGRAGELHDFLQTKLSSSFSGVTVDERPVDENDASKGRQVVVTVYAFCMGEIDRQAVEGLSRMAIDAFQPKAEIARVASEPTKFGLLQQLSRLEQEIRELRVAINQLP